MPAVKPLETRTIDWVDHAPIAAVATATTTASPDAVFAILADHVKWTEWFPAVRKVEVLGPAEGVGARRRVSIPGAVVEEEFIVWEPGVRWSFTGTAAAPRAFRALVEDCRLTPHAGGTSITYGMYIEPGGGLYGPLLRLARPMLASNIRKALHALARRAEAG